MDRFDFEDEIIETVPNPHYWPPVILLDHLHSQINETAGRARVEWRGAWRSRRMHGLAGQGKINVLFVSLLYTS